MFDKLESVFNSGGKIATLLLLIVTLIIPLIKLHCDNQEKAERILGLQNDVAERDSLKAVLSDSQTGNVVLSERNSFLEKDNITLRINHDAVKKRLKETDSKLLAYMESSTTLTLENQRLWGAIREGEVNGSIIVDFDTTNEMYSLTATVTILPPAYLDIHQMSFFDSTYAGIRFEDDTFVGIIGHTNPLIKDNGASFSYALQDVMPEYSPWGFRAGVGPAWDGDGKFAPAGLIGFKYRRWGLAGFMAGETKGIILTRDF